MFNETLDSTVREVTVGPILGVHRGHDPKTSFMQRTTEICCTREDLEEGFTKGASSRSFRRPRALRQCPLRLFMWPEMYRWAPLRNFRRPRALRQVLLRISVCPKMYKWAP